MDIIICYKLSPDSEDIKSLPEGGISYEKANWIVGDYDLIAAEAAAQLSKLTESTLIGLSVGGEKLKNTRMRKSMLARGCSELVLVQDESLEQADSHKTAMILAKAVAKIGKFDLIICGEGSSDEYARQVGLQLGELLNVSSINAISSLVSMEDGKLVAERTVGNTVETLGIPLPAVVGLTADICESCIPTMRDILNAGKKPVTELSLGELGVFENASTVIELSSPDAKDRRHIVLSGTAEEAAEALCAALCQDGLMEEVQHG